ncbi:MAG: acyltransferase family protein [Salinivirgaceae bacterium]|nr:acyltransferase family protein [Salinivirgaceae bacterium]
MNREHYIDNLKVWLTVLVIFHHAGQAYGYGGGWAYKPSNPDEFMPWIWHFFSVNAAFFMGLYFLISGYFVPTSYDRQGLATFIRKKLIRLGIPLLVMGGTICAITQSVEIAHMWFVESLLVFCLVYALMRLFCKPISGDCDSKPTIIGMTIVAVVMGVGSYFIRQLSPQDHWIWPLGVIPLPMEPAHYLQYVMMFILGVLARRFDWLSKMTDKVGAASMVVGALLAIGIYMRNGGWWDNFVWKWFGIYESFLCIFISFGLLWLFRKYFNHTSDFMQWCAAQSYGAYVVHLLLMLGLQFAFDGVWMGAFGKFMFIAIFSTILSYLLTWVLRLIPGVKKIL